VAPDASRRLPAPYSGVVRTRGLYFAVVCRGRCPCCREGAVFDGVFRFARRCSRCGLQYEQWVGDWITPTYLAGTVGTLVAVAVVVAFFASGRFAGQAIVWWALSAACASALLALRPSKALWLAFMWAVGGVEVSAETRAALRWREERDAQGVSAEAPLEPGLLADAEARAKAHPKFADAPPRSGDSKPRFGDSRKRT